MNLSSSLRNLTTAAILADNSPEDYREQANAAAQLRALIAHYSMNFPRLQAARAALKLNRLMDAAVAGDQTRIDNLTSELTSMY